MNSPSNIRLRLLSYVVIAYMLMAFAWWSVLLFTKNRDAFYAKSDYLKLVLVAKGEVKTNEEFYKSDVYQDLQKHYQRQEWMILGEALVFVFSLIVGIWLINRGYNKEVNAAKQRRNFLLSITHELKSPIASIRLVLETLLKRVLQREQQEKLMNTALLETDRLHMLVEDLLLSAKLETAYQPYVEPLNVSDLLQDLVHKLQIKYPAAVFNYTEKVENAIIIADKSGLTSVALNLLENAIKYSPDNQQIEVRLMQCNGRLRFEVADQGVGIPDKEKAQIFEKFYRVGNEDTRKTKGTGLGLYIVEQIVKAHQGTIEVLDNEPQGTVFSVELPIEKSA